MKKRLIPLLLIFAFLICLAGCAQRDSLPDVTKTPSDDTENPWDQVETIPFSGYICGVEDSEVLIQVLILGPPETELSGAQVTQSHLSHSDGGEIIPCRLSNVIHGTVSDRWRLYTLSLFVQFPSGGVHWVDQIELKLTTGETVLLTEGQIEIESLPAPAQNDLVSTRFHLNGDSYSSVTITYQNLSKTPLSVLGIEAGACYAGLNAVSASKDGVPVSSTLIPAGEERTFSFELEPKKDAFKTEAEQFIIMLPKLQYQTEDGTVIDCPAQTQATTIYPHLLIEYLDSLYLQANA